MRRIVKVEDVRMCFDMSNEPLSTVIVELEGVFDDSVAIRTEVVEEEYVSKLFRCIDKGDLAKKLVSFAWDMKDKVRNIVTAELNPQSLDIEFHITPYGYDNCYPELHPIIFDVAIDKDTFAKYTTKEDAIKDYKKIVTHYFTEFEEELSYLYDTIIDTKYEDIDGYTRKYIRERD